MWWVLWCFPPAGRPKVGSQGFLHEPVSKYIDFIIQPFVKRITSFLQDTTDFINKIEGRHIPSSSLILSFDVVSLYTNIPHEELREVLQDIFNKRETQHPPSHFLLDLVNFLTDYNYFRYDQDYFLQTKGVAMGSAFAPSTTNLFMERFKKKYILNDLNPFCQHITHYYCFIDDIFCVYNDPPSYHLFQEWLNQVHPSIKFTFSGDSSSVNFLDTTVFRTGHNTLAVKPFKKSIDKNKNSYLHFRSFHPRALRQNIPYGQFARIHRNSPY